MAFSVIYPLIKNKKAELFSPASVGLVLVGSTSPRRYILKTHCGIVRLFQTYLNRKRLLWNYLRPALLWSLHTYGWHP